MPTSTVVQGDVLKILPDLEALHPIPGCLGYFATRDGRIWSVPSKPGRPGRPWPGGFLRAKTDKDGHLHVTVCGPSGHKDRFVHHLVLETFVGPKPDGQECRHLDGNPAHNAVENLCWGTRKENYEDSVKHGTDKLNEFCRRLGHDNGRTLLHENDVRLIRQRAAEGARVADLARAFGRSRGCINHIISRKNWSHVE